MLQSYVIRETKDYYSLSVLFHNSGMKIEVSETPPPGIVKMWRIDEPDAGGLIAAATLQIRDGVYTLGDIAVRQDHRYEGLGKILQQAVFEEARKTGVKELWGSAKFPDYYYRFGWKPMDWDSSPKVGVNCHTCSKRNKTCFPAIIRIIL